MDPTARSAAPYAAYTYGVKSDMVYVGKMSGSADRGQAGQMRNKLFRFTCFSSEIIPRYLTASVSPALPASGSTKEER